MVDLLRYSPASESREGPFAADRAPLLVGSGTAVLCLLVYALFSFSKIPLLLTLGISMLALFVLSFEMTVFIFVAILFSTQDAIVTKIAVPFVAVVLFSFVVTHRDLRLRDLDTPLTHPLLLYFLTMLPSLFNSPDVGLTLLTMQSFAAFAVLLLVVGTSIGRPGDIRKYLGAFLGATILNALVVIGYNFATGKKTFGVPGAVFVDYGVVALMVLLALLLFSRGVRRFLAVAAVGVIFVSLLLTQTRNILFGFAMSSFMCAGYLYLNNDLVGVSRRSLVKTGLFVVGLTAGAVVGTLAVYPQAFQRIAELGVSGSYTMRSEDDFSLNSIVTRGLIWMTAWKAFLAHPFVGIGAYSFPFASAEYFDIPPILYKRYVGGLSPHVTYLAILVETGILGLCGFLWFLLQSFRLSLKAVKLSLIREERLLSVALLFVQVYIAVSMTYTDAWLWGQCGMLWGLVAGLSLGNYRVLVAARRENPPIGR